MSKAELWRACWQKMTSETKNSGQFCNLYFETHNKETLMMDLNPIPGGIFGQC